MVHYMIDIETLDILPTAVVLTIGAVRINKNLEIDDEFYIKLDIDNQMDASSTVSGSTVEWWGKQDMDVQNQTFGGTATMKEAADALDEFLTVKDKSMMWAQGSDFDFPILGNLFRNAGYKEGVPWRFYRQCDLRTMLNFVTPEYYRFTDAAASHNALEDAKVQARALINILNVVDFIGIKR